MILVIDSGNTNIVFAVFDKSNLVGKWRISSDSMRTADEYLFNLSYLISKDEININQIEGVIISNVVPQITFSLKEFCEKYIGKKPLIIGENNVFCGIDIKTDNPDEVGADRLVNCVSAIAKYGNNLVIIDFGTATTFDVVNNDNQYIGGVIAPGINLSMAALHKAAAKLPQIDVKKPPSVIGTSTITAMQSGIYWGYVGLIDGIIDKIKQEKNINYKVIATGGLAPLFLNASNAIEYLENDLTISGLEKIYRINKLK